MSINELFGTKSNELSTNARMLSGTAELTRIASEATRSIIQSMEANIDDYRERIAESATDAKTMDELIAEFPEYLGVPSDNVVRFLSEETVDGMLKSQQSKRSRTKGKTMTLDNYASLMTAAIAEHLLRRLYDKPKAAHVGYRAAGSIDYTPAQLEAFAADQEALKREIRNVQSKKSIMKSKDGFDPSSERWAALLKAEQMLKDLRTTGRDHTKDALNELLAGVDPEHLKAADAKELLARIMSMAQADNVAELTRDAEVTDAE